MKSLRSQSGGILRVIVMGLVGLVVLVALGLGAAYAVSNSIMHKTHSVEARPVFVANAPEIVARGKHIAVTRGCSECHGADFSGNKVVDDPMVGKLFGPNITTGRGGLASGYTDMDYVRAIRHGLTRDGRPLVLMPSAEYSKLSDEDLGALIAFMKTVSPVDKASGPVAPGPILRVLMALGKVKLGADEINHGEKRPVSVPMATTAQYGHYLSYGCVGCHGENLSGGKIPGGPPDWPPAANLTPHPTSRVSTWTQTDFTTALRTRKRPDGTDINPVMPAAFGQMTDVEITALWLYVKSLPPVPTGERPKT